MGERGRGGRRRAAAGPEPIQPIAEQHVSKWAPLPGARRPIPLARPGGALPYQPRTISAKHSSPLGMTAP